jgi:hypothetical protein
MFLISASQPLAAITYLILLGALTLIVKWQKAKFLASEKKRRENIRKKGKLIKVPFDDIIIRVKKIHQVRQNKNSLIAKKGITENYSEAEPGTEQDMCCLVYNLKIGSKEITLESEYFIEDKKNMEIKLFMNEGIDVYYDLQSEDYFFDTDVLFK